MRLFINYSNPGARLLSPFLPAAALVNFPGSCLVFLSKFSKGFLCFCSSAASQPCWRVKATIPLTSSLATGWSPGKVLVLVFLNHSSKNRVTNHIECRIWAAYHAMTNQPRDPHLASHWWWHVFQWVVATHLSNLYEHESEQELDLVVLAEPPSDSWKDPSLLAPCHPPTRFHFQFVLGQSKFYSSVCIWTIGCILFWFLDLYNFCQY